MNKFKLKLSLEDFKGPFIAVFWLAVLTILFLLTGRDIVGTPVIALLYLVPITWCTVRYGQLSGIAASITATLVFDFYFIPPYDTFTIGSPEGWLILIIFLLVSVLVVGQIQTVINQARMSEREAIIMYELVSSLTTLHSRETIARTLASSIQQDFQAKQVSVTFYKTDAASMVRSVFPEGTNLEEKPSRILVIDTQRELAGDISIWKGDLPLPTEKSWLLQSFIRQTALALDRVEIYSHGESNNAMSDVNLIGKQL
jgi:K+-sensing histidine kinase KdpD